MRAVLFDLDDTLIDTAPIKPLREALKWRECVGNAGRTVAFQGVAQTLGELRRRGIKIAIVTTSVSYYAEAILRYHNLPYDTLVAYHDARPQKPHPKPALLALERLGCQIKPSAAVGDNTNDVGCFQGAGIYTFGAGWSPALDRGLAWNMILDRPEELLQFFPAIQA